MLPNPVVRSPAVGAPDEQDWLRHLAERLPPAPAGETWVGDDAAVLEAPDGWVLLSIDSVVAGVHADLGLMGLDDVGWKALARGVSDVAAMGGRPWRAVVAVSGPPDVDLGHLYDGVDAASAAFGCPVVGGDLSSADQLVVTVAVTGVVQAGEAPPVLRSGARAGDRIWATGPMGRAAAGLRLLRAGSVGAATDGEAAAALTAQRRPEPRLAAGETARRNGATAMVDVSDGLAIDLGRLAEASGLAAVLMEVPTAPGATREEALGGGDDYELVICTPPDIDLAGAYRRAGLDAPVPIGRCQEGEAGAVLLDGQRLAVTGWRHWARG